MSGPRQAPSRERLRRRLARTPGLRTVNRPLPDGSHLGLAYTRTGPRHALPILVFPGGPGLASVLPYGSLRRKAAGLGLDVVMVEHRGVGMSRANDRGEDLPREAITIREVLADAAAVLEAEGIERVIVYGASYGSYLAQGFGVLHPTRVTGMVLDSVVLDASSQLTATTRLNDLFWRGTPATEQHARRVRELVTAGDLRAAEAGLALQIVHEFGGLAAVDALLTLLERGKGRRVGRWLAQLGKGEVTTPRPFVMEFDLVGEIAIRELDFAAAPKDPERDPLSTDAAFAEASGGFTAFEHEPFTLPDELPAFAWPVLVLSGDRDIRAPRTIARQVAALIPDARTVEVREHGHSALDTAPTLAMQVMRHLRDELIGAESAQRLPADPIGERSLFSRILAGRLALARHVPSWLS